MARHNRRSYCHNCERSMSSYGIMNHRKMHARRKELVTITMSDGAWTYDCRDPEPTGEETKQ